MNNADLPELPEILIKFGAELRASAPDEMGDGGALPYAVWDKQGDAIIGAGFTPEEAIEEATAQVLAWCPAAQDFE